MKSFLYKRKDIWDYVLIIVGTGLVGFSIQCIFDPAGLVLGGFSGIAIIVKTVTESLIPGGIPLWITNIMLNVPVFLFALKIKGWRFIGRTLFGTVMLSAWLYLIPAVNMIVDDTGRNDYILAAVFGGLFAGAGAGMVLLAKATTGGTDMVAALIHHKLKHHSIAKIIQTLDGLVVLCGLYVFGMHATLYAAIAIFVTAKTTDILMEGIKFSKAVFVVSDQYQVVADRIMEEMERGVTGLKATGMYSGNSKCMLYCVVSPKEVVQVKEIVAAADPHAFVTVSDAREVLGEGFLEYNNQ